MKVEVVLVLVVMFSCMSCSFTAKQIKNVRERGLVSSEDIYARSILKEHSKFSPNDQSSKLYSQPTLAYVTPWNNKGYEVAKVFASKFTYISPVWYQMVYHPSERYNLRGQHDVDQGWIAEVRKGNGKVKITPRILFEGWSPELYQSLFSSSSHRDQLCSLILNEVLGKGYDGVVLDMGYINPSKIGPMFFQFLSALHSKFQSRSLTLILVIPPGGLFKGADYEAAYPFVSHFQMMTYDFPESNKGNAPIEWIKSVIKGVVPSNHPEMMDKLMMGINFYGRQITLKNYDNDADHLNLLSSYDRSSTVALVNHQYLELLSKYRPVHHWLPSPSNEHYFIYTSLPDDDETATGSRSASGSGDTFCVFYPTLQYIDERLELAKGLGIGVAIWEIGQGLDYFYDLL